ncbi:hypothetical protein BH11PSE3_BH11PSE3_33560 [soil metagenome]
MFSALTGSIAALLAMVLGAAPAGAQDAATVKVGPDVKRAFGTITAMTAGDIACYLKLKDDRGAAFEEMAAFEICEQRALLGKRVALTYVQQNVQSSDCQGDPVCKKTKRVVLVSAARPAPAVAAATATPSPSVTSKGTGQGTGQASLCSKDESVVFSCRSGGKLVSVCASQAAGPARGTLHYRFGKPGPGEPLELALPEAPTPPAKAATGQSVPFAGGGGAWLRFTRGLAGYTVYTGIGKWGPKGEVREKAGLVVERQGKAVATLRCTGDVESELGPAWFERMGVTAGGQDFDFPD